MKRILWLALLVALLLSACAGGSTSETSETGAGSYTNISVDELEQMLQNKDFTMVNVHIPFEGDLPNTDLSIPYDEIDQYLDQLPAKDEKIVLYCRSDRMSHIAADVLVEQGYTNVYNLEGGFVAWENAGLPMAGE